MTAAPARGCEAVGSGARRTAGRRGRRPLRGEAVGFGEGRTTGRRGRRPLRGECEAVRCRRRGGRPRPPADMVECRTNGPPGASAPTAVRPWVWARICGTSGMPSPTGLCGAVRRCGNGGRGKPLPYGDGRARCETNTGRRGRRPLRGGARPFVSVVGAAALGRPRTW